MKKLYILFLMVPALVLAQSQDQNYIKSTTYKVETDSSIEDPQPNQASVFIQYYDGLGRPVQQVAHKQSNTGKDIIVHIEYDAYGRQVKEFLPYVRSTASMEYDDSGLSSLTTFYGSNSIELTGNPYFETTGNPYSQKELEHSPLSRVYKQAAPGDEWALGNGKEIKFDYQSNERDEVLLFKVTTDPLSGIYEPILVQGIGFYNPNQLYKTIIKDENWTSGLNNTTEEFKNKQGQVVLKRTYNNGDKYDTYYVYDTYGNLTFVIPPKVDAEQTITSTHLDGLCYQYKYDHRNRLAEKKLPGKQWEFIVYDKLDRPVATGPAFSPYGGSETGWLITKYDVFSRVVYTGWKSEQNISSSTRNILQNQLSLTTLPLFETKTTSPNSINNISINYTNNAYPTSDFELLTINYYDNYDFSGAPEAIPDLINGQEVLDNVKSLPTGSWVRFLETANDNNGELNYTFYDKKARPIQTKSANHLGGFTDVTSILDFEGKTGESITIHKRDADALTVVIKDEFKYTPQSKLIFHVQTINNNPKELISRNEYDELGQLIVKHVGGEAINDLLGHQKVDYKYNIRGWLKEINDVYNFNHSAGNFTDLFAFKINYNTVTRKNLNTQEIEEVDDSYNQKVKKLYNGNIAETYWRSSSDNLLRKYSYAYDNLNRLNEAYYQKPESNIEARNSYNETLKYDKNGNIERLERTGNYDGDLNAMLIDELDYKYEDKSNILLKVTDGTNSSLGFKDDSNGTNDQEDDYEYDVNGNMIADQNKGITKIFYNHLNLPVFIEFVGIGQSISYFYNANGVKLKKVVNNGEPLYELITTDYLGGFQYKDDVLQFFAHPEGYVNFLKDRFSYVYNYTDHLGNIRLSYGLDPKDNVLKILEENHYYPFGLKHTNYLNDIKKFTFEPSPIGFNNPEEYKIKQPTDGSLLEYKYKYNGKEWQDELGLNFYDYGARNYDPAIGRWMNIDPLAETSRRFSPYAYALVNPVYFIDPDGMEAASSNGHTTMREDMIEQANPTRYYERSADSKAAELLEQSNEKDRRSNTKKKEKNWFAQFREKTRGWIYENIKKPIREELKPFREGIAIIREVNSEILSEQLGPLYEVQGMVGGGTASGLLVGRSIITTNTSRIALRKVGSVLESVDDVMANPNLLKGKSPLQVERILGKTPGWRIETLGQGSQKGNGWVLRQYNAKGNPTGPQLRWHPGGGHHGPTPYWRVLGTNGDLGGIIR